MAPKQFCLHCMNVVVVFQLHKNINDMVILSRLGIARNVKECICTQRDPQ